MKSRKWFSAFAVFTAILIQVIGSNSNAFDFNQIARQYGISIPPEISRHIEKYAGSIQGSHGADEEDDDDDDDDEDRPLPPPKEVVTRPAPVVQPDPAAEEQRVATPIAGPTRRIETDQTKEDPWEQVWKNIRWPGTDDVVTTTQPPKVEPNTQPTDLRDRAITSQIPRRQSTVPAGSTAPIVENDERAGSRPAPARATTSDQPESPSKPSIVYKGNGNIVTWDGCADALIRGKDGNARNCGSANLDRSFANMMKKHFVPCMQEAARAAGVPEPKSVFILHWGAMVGKPGNHGHGRAIDLRSVQFLDDAGKQVFNLSMDGSQYKGQNKAAYDTFRRCWRDNSPKKPGCTGPTGGSIGIPGSTKGFYNDGAHYDHLHLELYPACGRVD